MAQDDSWCCFGPALIVGGFGLLIYFLVTRKSLANYPPGPTALPIFGNLLQIARAKNLPTFLCDMRKVYGDCFRVYFGQIPVVVFFGYENIKKIMVDGKFCNDRPSRNNKGILFGNGKKWSLLQNLIVSTQHEKLVLENIQRTIETELLDARDVLVGNTVIDPADLCQKWAFSVTSALVFGERFDVRKAEIQAIKQKFEFSVQHTRTYREISFIPLFDYLPTVRSKKAKLAECDKAAYEFFKQKLEQHNGDFVSSSPRDMMDMYLKQGKMENIDDEEFFTTCLDLFVAGIDGLVSTSLSAMLYLVKYPDYQRKCREEISELVPRDRNVTLADIPKLKFVNAYIKEVLRYSRTVATSVFRSTGDNSVTVGQYTISPNHVVIFEYRDPHMDHTLWDAPEIFNPERWTTSDEPYPGFMPLGTGQRPCVGKDLAILNLQLIVSNMIKNYDLQAEDDENLTFSQFYTGTSLRPQPFKIKVTELA